MHPPGTMKKSQPDGTEPLPETAELGGEGGSFGDSSSKDSRQHRRGVRPVDEPITDIAGNATRLPDVEDATKDPADR